MASSASANRLIRIATIADPTGLTFRAQQNRQRLFAFVPLRQADLVIADEVIFLGLFLITCGWLSVVAELAPEICTGR